MKQWIVLAISLLLVTSSNAAEFVSPSQPPALSSIPQNSNSDCSTVVYGMFDCLSFLSVGSTDLSPTKSCCDGVKSVLEYNPNCFCVGLEGSRQMGLELINSRALAMPSTCNIPIDPHCDNASSPTASPPVASTEPTTSSPSQAKPAAVTPSLPAKSPAVTTPKPSNSTCSTVVYSMIDCLSYLTVGSTDHSPTRICCDGVQTVLNYNPNCFCVALESSSEMGFELITSRALGIPSTCSIRINPHCDVASTPPTTSPSIPRSTAITNSSTPSTTLSPSFTHSSPAPTALPPSISGTGSLSLSNLVLVAVIVSSFVHIIA